MKKLLTLCLFGAFLIFTASAQSLDFEQMAEHPRLMLRSGDITAMRALSSHSAAARMAHDKIITASEQILSQTAVEYSAELDAEQVLQRVVYLSYAYLTTDDMRYARRAEQEMLAVSAFKEWSATAPATMPTLTMALAVGYDWLYRALPVHSRSIIGTAIYEKGLRPMEGITYEDSIGRVGLLLGALATADRAPEYCRGVIVQCATEAEDMLKGEIKFSNIDEWSREAALQAIFAASLRSALAVESRTTSEQLLSAQMMSYAIAPSMQFYNFGGASAEAKSLVAKYWVAMQSNDPSLVLLDERLATEGKFIEDFTLPLYMLFATGVDTSKARLPHDKMWREAHQTVIYRSGWDADDTYLAIKGGDAKSAGEYVFETGGVRWTLLTGEVDGRLVIDGVSSDGEGQASVREVTEATRQHGAVIDLSSLYSAQATSVVRSVMLGKGDKLVVTDNISTGSQPSTVEWSITTAAHAEIVAPNTIQLSEGGHTLTLKIRSRANAEAKIWPDANGVRRVGFVLTLSAGSQQSVEITFTPDGKKGITLPRLNLLRRNN